MSIPALFLDRDGVINVDHGYVHREEDVEFIPGIFELVREANLLGYRVIVITNQAGIARGYYNEQRFLELTRWMEQQFATAGARLDATYFCPHHPEHGQGTYLCNCGCRKPAPGMLLRAAVDHEIDLTNSIFIGDKLSDMQAALAAGVGLRLLLKQTIAESKGQHQAAELCQEICLLHEATSLIKRKRFLE